MRSCYFRIPDLVRPGLYCKLYWSHQTVLKKWSQPTSGRCLRGVVVPTHWWCWKTLAAGTLSFRMACLAWGRETLDTFRTTDLYIKFSQHHFLGCGGTIKSKKQAVMSRHWSHRRIAVPLGSTSKSISIDLNGKIQLQDNCMAVDF